MAMVHNSKKRMPVILEKSNENKWLDLTIGETEALQLLKPCPSEILTAYTISDLVNKKTSERNSSEVIKPYNWNIEGILF